MLHVLPAAGAALRGRDVRRHGRTAAAGPSRADRPWQVSGRSNLSWAETVRLDVYYVDNWSMLQDLSILVKTFRAVVGSDGAY